MKIKPFKAIYPNLELVSSPESFFGTVKHDYPEYVQNGFFNQRPREAFYVYEIVTANSSHLGIITAVDIDNVIKGNIRKHENTLAHKEQKMMHLLLQRKAMVKPVLLGHTKCEELEQFMKAEIKNKKTFFTIDFIEKVETHRFWEITQEKKIDELKELFKKHIPKAYIADGHHRCATTTKLYQTKQIKSRKNDRSVLAVFFSFDQLEIYDFNRVIDLFHDVDPTLFGIKLSEYCKIEPLEEAGSPQKKHHFHMYINRQWYRLQWKKKILKKYRNEEVLLDVSLFNHYVLEEILRVPDVREDRRIKYVEGTLGQEAISNLVDKDENFVGFSFFPLKAEEIMTVADLDKTLPPKSSYFEPRIKNGLIVKDF